MANGHGGARKGAGRPALNKTSHQRFQSARAAKEESLAELRRLQVAREQGALVPREAVLDTWARALGVLRQRLLSLPAKVSGACANQPAVEVQAIIGREVRQALSELANTDGLPQQ